MGDQLVNVRDSASSSETAFALAQGLLLPGDMQKELASALERLACKGMVNGIKVYFSSLQHFSYYYGPVHLLYLHSNFSPLLVSVHSKDGGAGPKAKRNRTSAQ